MPRLTKFITIDGLRYRVNEAEYNNIKALVKPFRSTVVKTRYCDAIMSENAAAQRRLSEVPPDKIGGGHATASEPAPAGTGIEKDAVPPSSVSHGTQDPPKTSAERLEKRINSAIADAEEKKGGKLTANQKKKLVNKITKDFKK